MVSYYGTEPGQSSGLENSSSDCDAQAAGLKDVKGQGTRQAPSRAKAANSTATREMSPTADHRRAFANRLHRLVQHPPRDIRA